MPLMAPAAARSDVRPPVYWYERQLSVHRTGLDPLAQHWHPKSAWQLSPHLMYLPQSVCVCLTLLTKATHKPSPMVAHLHLVPC